MTDPSRAALSRLLQDYSIEITPGGKEGPTAFKDHLPRGTEVYIASPPPDLHKYAADTAHQVREAGFEPVPHIAARSVPSTAQLDQMLARLVGEAGVTKVLAIGGDVPKAAGPYQSSLEVIRTGLLEKHGIRRVGVAFYAEPHPAIPVSVARSELEAKLDYLAAHGMDAVLVGQFCFEADPIIQTIRELRAAGITAPVRIGLAGPASRKTLWKYALRCGIGNSIRALGSQTERMTQLLTRDTPDAILHELASKLGDPAMAGVDGLHFFTFGGIAETARWVDGIVTSTAQR